MVFFPNIKNTSIYSWKNIRQTQIVEQSTKIPTYPILFKGVKAMKYLGSVTEDTKEI